MFLLYFSFKYQSKITFLEPNPKDGRLLAVRLSIMPINDLESVGLFFKNNLSLRKLKNEFQNPNIHGRTVGSHP